ncbi:MAG: HD domain-containing protein [Proteobacteria bacterium]|nr:HD domain-containing protein [Pseudomonadota bacterium]MBS0572061.1 HD domain-containing protein [Pseudomonadota bacterium]
MSLTSDLRRNLRAALAQVLEDGGGDAAHDLAHADRVWMNARAIALGEGHDPSPVLMAAAYLHDLVTLPKDHPDRARASALSATAAGPVMEALGFAAREIAVARHAIEAHSYSAGIEPLLPEAAILRDADRIEALGAIGIARCFAVAGALGRPLFDADDPFARDRAADDRAYALDHFAVKLLKLPEGMLTATGRKLAAERAEAMRRWLRDLARELQARPADW